MNTEIYKFAPHWKDVVNRKLKGIENSNQDLSEIKVIMHNASWCPDCEREVTELLALCESLKNKSPKLELISYEDKEEYKKKKSQGKLSITALPTFEIIKNDILIGKIIEKSNGGFLNHLQTILE